MTLDELIQRLTEIRDNSKVRGDGLLLLVENPDEHRSLVLEHVFHDTDLNGIECGAELRFRLVDDD